MWILRGLIYVVVTKCSGCASSVEEIGVMAVRSTGGASASSAQVQLGEIWHGGVFVRKVGFVSIFESLIVQKTFEDVAAYSDHRLIRVLAFAVVY